MEFSIIEINKFLVVQVAGEMMPSDLMALYQANHSTNADRIYDLSHVQVDINLTEYQKFVHYLEKSDHNGRDNYKVAVVFNKALDTRFAHVIQAAQQHSLNNPIRVFYDMGEAQDWLKPEKKTWFQKLKKKWF